MDSTFIEHAGLYWKQLLGGGIASLPYCPTCHKQLVSRLHYQHLHCTACGLLSKFKQSELQAVFNEIPQGPRDNSKDRYFEHDGLAWKRERHGMVELMPYCTSCHVPLTTNQNSENIACPQCGATTALPYGDVPQAWAKAVHSIKKPVIRIDPTRE